MQQRRRREQRGTIVAIADRWFVRFYRDVSENGEVKRKRVSHCLGPVEGRAKKHPPHSIKQAAEEHVRKAVGSTVIHERAGLTVGQFIERVYLPMIEETKRPATSAQSRGIWQRHLKPQFLQVETKRVRAADLLVQDVETFHVQSWLDAIASSSKQALSKSVLKQCKFLLSGAFKLALQRGYRSTEKGHPVEYASIPARTVAQQPTHAYSSEEVTTMLRVLDEPARTIVMLMAETGLRISELRGLRWEDLDGSTLTINRSCWKNYTSEPKTAASKAPIPIPRQLSEMLEMHRALDGFPQDGPMFRTGLGTRLSMDNIRSRQILPVLDRCAVCKKAPGRAHRKEYEHEYERDQTMPRWRGWHAFRRGLATDLVNANEAVTVAQGVMRHADGNVTLKCYAKPVAESVRRSVQERADRLEIGLTDTSGTVELASGAKPDTVN
jgi:integrase